MSGGSMNYLYSKIECNANFSLNTPERRAFDKHLKLVTKALRDIEWVDSGDSSPGDENEAILQCLSIERVLQSLIEEAEQTMDLLKAQIAEAKDGK